MEGLNHGSSPLLGKEAALFQDLAPQIILIHHRQVLSATQLIIRFENGYGVALLPVSPAGDDPILDMLVLRFHGPTASDYQVVQYAPIPEFNRGSHGELMDLCRQVSLLPKSQTLTRGPDQPRKKVKKKKSDCRDNNFY